MTANDHCRKLERMYLSAAVNQYFRPSIRIQPGTAEVRIPIRPDFFHAAGAAHGLVYFKALDDSTFFAVSSLVEDVFVLTTTFTLYFLRPISSGEMVANGRVVHQTRRLFIAESVAVDEQGREVARGSGTFMRSQTALGPGLGYV